jgi:hypothetical protein
MLSHRSVIIGASLRVELLWNVVGDVLGAIDVRQFRQPR